MSDEYPDEASRHKWGGVVYADLSIDDKGRITACRVVVSSGHDVLDKAACRVIKTSSRYQPALDEAGQPIASGIIVPFLWTLPGQKTVSYEERGPDLVIYVKQLPTPAEEMKVTLRMVQNADGTPVSCVVVKESPSAALNRAACRAAAPLTGSDPVLDANGTPVRNLRMRRIVFAQSK